jgi:hypothetical protein
MTKVSTAETAKPLEQGLNNYGARQFEYAFVKRLPASTPRGTSASGFVSCGCETSYCVGAISCVSCVSQLRHVLRTASSSVASALRLPQLRNVLRPELRPPELRRELRPVASVACQLRQCASPRALLSRSLRITRRAATAMKVQRTAERLAHLIEQHQRALRELVKLSAPRHGSASESSACVSSSASPSSASSASSSSPLRWCASGSSAPGSASSSTPRPCELSPSASVNQASSSRELSSRELSSGQSPQLRESPLRRFALVASKTPSVASVAYVPVVSVAPPPVASPSVASPVALVVSLRSPKRTLH